VVPQAGLGPSEGFGILIDGLGGAFPARVLIAPGETMARIAEFLATTAERREQEAQAPAPTAPERTPPEATHIASPEASAAARSSGTETAATNPAAPAPTPTAPDQATPVPAAPTPHPFNPLGAAPAAAAQSGPVHDVDLNLTFHVGPIHLPRETLSQLTVDDLLTMETAAPAYLEGRMTARDGRAWRIETNARTAVVFAPIHEDSASSTPALADVPMVALSAQIGLGNRPETDGRVRFALADVVPIVPPQGGLVTVLADGKPFAEARLAREDGLLGLKIVRLRDPAPAASKDSVNGLLEAPAQ
ncbi:MAG: hypothetical protein AAF638_13310, partial [Pseudomonadota bacterium]